MHMSVRFLVSAFIFTATACGSSSTPTYGGGGGGGGGCTSTSNSITIADFSFSPSCTTVPLNTVVTWTNNGPTAHTTTSDVSGQWDSGQMAATNTYPHTFNSAGTFAYHCTNHPSMMATIVVTP
jgi:plastocyanin